MEAILDRRTKSYRILLGDYKVSARGKAGNYLRDKDGFDVRFKQKERAKQFIKQFIEYLEKKKTRV